MEPPLCTVNRSRTFKTHKTNPHGRPPVIHLNLGQIHLIEINTKFQKIIWNKRLCNWNKLTFMKVEVIKLFTSRRFYWWPFFSITRRNGTKWATDVLPKEGEQTSAYLFKANEIRIRQFKENVFCARFRSRKINFDEQFVAIMQLLRFQFVEIFQFPE